MRLAAKADVIVENYRPDIKTKLGVDYESVIRCHGTAQASVRSALRQSRSETDQRRRNGCQEQDCQYRTMQPFIAFAGQGIAGDADPIAANSGEHSCPPR